jgi:hypothetical protein
MPFFSEGLNQINKGSCFINKKFCGGFQRFFRLAPFYGPFLKKIL